MRSIYECSNEELLEADKFLFEIEKNKNEGLMIDGAFFFEEEKSDVINQIEPILKNEFLITNEVYPINKFRYRLTPKGESILKLYGGVSVYAANQRFQNSNLIIAEKSLKQSKFALWVTGVALVVSILKDYVFEFIRYFGQ